MKLGLAMIACYALMAAALAGVAFGQWRRSRVENQSLPLLIHNCHVEGHAKACREITQRKELRP